MLRFFFIILSINPSKGMMMSQSSAASPAPIFHQYGLDELHKRLGYSYAHLEGMATGRVLISLRFRFNACAILARTEEELFGSEETPSC